MSLLLPPDLRDRLSLCMIVRDEARALARCLQSVQGVVGEMVVVDSGSTDGTVEIARSFGARVDHFPWQNDFAASRNRSLELATRPWALVLDGDEWLELTRPELLAAALRQTAKVGFLVEVRNVPDPATGVGSSAPVFRLFRRDVPGMRYRGQLHEQVAAVADRKVSTGRLEGLVLHHDGYLPEVRAAKEKTKRNLALARALVVQRPDDPFAWYSLGTSQKDPSAQVESLERALALVDQRSEWHEHWVSHLFVHLPTALYHAGKKDRAEAVVRQGLSRCGERPDYRYLLGELLAERGHAGEALESLARVPALVERPGSVVTEGGRLRYLAGRKRAGLLIDQKHPGEAIPQLQAIAPDCPKGDLSLDRLLGALLVEVGRCEEALPLLERVAQQEPIDGPLALPLHEALLAVGRTADALLVLGSVWREVEVTAAITRVVASLAETAPDQLQPVVLEWYENDPGQPDACFWLGTCAASSGLRDEAKALWTQALALRPEFAAARNALAAAG